MSLEGKSPDEIQALAELAADVLGNPKTAGTFQRLVKHNNPGISMPMVELEDKAAAAFANQQKKIDALDGKLAQSDAEKHASALFENLRDDGVVTTRASFNELVTWANGNGFVVNEMGLRKAAMQRTYEQEAAEPTPATVGHGAFSLGQGEDGKSFMKDPTGHARTVASQAMDELRKQRGKGQIH